MGWCYCPSPCRQGSLCSNRHFLPTESCIWLEVTRGGRGKQSDVPPTLPSSFVISATYSMFSQNWHDPQPYQHQQQRWKWKVFWHNVAGWRMICWTKSTKKEGLVYCIFSSIFCEDLSFDRGDRKPGKDPDEDGYKKSKEGRESSFTW